MKIDNFTPSTDLHSGQVDKAQQVENTRSQRTQRGPNTQDTASISSLTQQIALGLEDTPAQIARVAEAQEIYQSGGFNQVPTEEVADALIQSAIADTALFAQVSGPSRDG